MAETETEEDIDWSQFSKEPPIDWSQYSNVRPTPKLEAPPGVLSDAEMGPEQIDRSGILSGPQAGVAAIGKGLHAAGKLARNVLGAYAFEAVGEPELQAQQLGAAAKGVGVETPPWMQPEGEEPPLEEGMKRLPTPLRIAAEVPYGLAQSAPQIAGVIGAQAAGVPAPLAAAAVFGTTEEGFDPKQAAVAAALPFIGRLGGEIAGAFAKKVGVSTAEAVNLIKKAGGLGSVAGYLGIMDLSAIMALPPEQRKEAAVNAFSSQLAMLMFGPQGVRTEGPRIARPGVATVEVGGRATPVPEVPPTLEAGRGEISTRPEPKLLTEGEPNARSVEETAAVHGDLRPPTGEGEGQVPVPQGRGGVQPLEGGRQEGQAQGEVSLTPQAVSKMTPEEYFEDAAAKSKATMEGKGDGLSVQTRAEQAAVAHPDVAEWSRMRDEAVSEALKVRDEIKAEPKTMMARQKEMIGAAQKVQFFNEGLKVLEGKKAPEPVPQDVKAESERISAAKIPSPAAPPEYGGSSKTAQPERQILRDALKRIGDNPNSQHAGLAKRILKLGDEAGLNVTVMANPSLKGRRVGGVYSPIDDSISLHPERLNDDQTVVHEAIHALTSKKLAQEITGTYGIENLHKSALDGYLETGKDKNVKELINLFNEVRKRPESKGHYGAMDFQEFLAESFSNAKFQEHLSGIKTAAGKKTLWQRFIAAIRKLLGLKASDDSVLGKTIQHAEELVKTPRPEPTEAVAKPEPASPLAERPKTARELGVPGIALPRFGPTGREGGNEAGFVDLGPVYDWLTTIGPKTRYVIERTLRNLGYTRESARRFFKGGKVREAMGVLRGAGENESNIFGRQMGNEIRQPMTREKWTYNPPGKLKQLAKKAAAKRISEDALSFVVEARRNLTKLQEFRDLISNSAIAHPYWKSKALEAIDFARANWAKLDPHAARYKEITDAQLDTENRNGVDTLRREGYVPHQQDVVDPWEAFKAGGNGGGGMFRKTREHETFADSIAAGVNPKSLNAVDLLESRVQAGTRIVNYRVWIQGLRNATDPITGHPIVADPVVKTRPDGSTYQEAPPGYSLEHVRNQPVAIHNGFEGMFTALNDPSVFARSMAGRGLMKAAQGGKSMALVFDTFHLGRVAFWNGLLRAAGIKSAQFPAFWKYGRGKTLVDFTIPQIRQMVAHGEIPAKWGRELVQDKQILNHLLAQGYNLGRISDSMHQEWVRAIPGIGHFNKFLFEKFQRGAMSEIGLLEFKRLKAARPNMPDAAIARYVSKALNKRFGNLGFDSIIKRKSFQDVARVLTLAPQWNEGLIRSELGGIILEPGKFVFEAAREAKRGTQRLLGMPAPAAEKIYAGILMRSTLGMMLGYLLVNQIINQYTRGKFTWENPEEGIGAKLSAWVPDFIGGGPGFFLNPMSLAAETTHLLLDKYQKTEDFRKALMQYARSRSGTLTKPLMTFITNEDFLGRRIKPGGIWAAMAKEAVPVPIAAPALAGAVAQKVSGEPREAYPGQFQKQGMASFGVRSEGTPSPGTRIARLANKFNVEHGVMRFEFAPSEYADLRAALVVGNKTEARAQIEQLLKKNTPAAIERALKSSATRNFTQSNALEKQFRATLNPEQRKAYEQAIQDRLKVARSGIELLQEVWKESQKPKK